MYLGSASSNSYKTLDRKPEQIQPSVAVLHGVKACLSEDWFVLQAGPWALHVLSALPEVPWDQAVSPPRCPHNGGSKSRNRRGWR